jgi:hypothetical protein
MDDIQPQFIEITKTDAVLRQLETAITLWFNNGDSLSIHTLAAAAYQILYDLNKHQKGPPMMRDSDLIDPNMKDEWRKALKACPNFLKHADKDPHKTIRFSPDSNMTLLFESVMEYSEITGKKSTPILHCMYTWTFIHRPLFFQTDRADMLRKSLSIENFINLDRPEFFREMTQII